jgi:hypothetical protein
MKEKEKKIPQKAFANPITHPAKVPWPLKIQE